MTRILLDVFTEHSIAVEGPDPENPGSSKIETIDFSGWTLAGLRGARHHGATIFGQDFVKVNFLGLPRDLSFEGINKWLHFAQQVRELFDVPDEFDDGISRPLLIYPGVLFFRMTSGRWAVQFMFEPFDNFPQPPIEDGDRLRVASCAREAGVASTSQRFKFQEEYIFPVNNYPPNTANLTIFSPVGLWQPCALLSSMEPVDVRANVRFSESPYSSRYRTSLYWGTEYRSECLWDLVPAAEIFGYRRLDIPCDGWARVAGAEPSYGVGSTLEWIWPKMQRATAQTSLTFPYGRPIVAIVDPENPESLTSDDMVRFEEAYSIGSVVDGLDLGFSRMHRHFLLPSSASNMASTLNVREGTNRRYRVEIPFIDVTPRPDTSLNCESLYRESDD